MTVPGATPLTRTWGASSSASTWVSMCIADFVMQYAA